MAETVTAAAKPTWTPSPGKALVMRTCSDDMTSYHGQFTWPREGEVSCPDWDPVAHCGNGLHGLLWGAGDGGLLDWAEDVIWLVVEVDEAACVELDGKVKFPSATVLYAGERLTAAALVQEHAPSGMPVVSGTATAGDSGTATAGYRGTATAGYRGTATAGDEGAIAIFWYDSAKGRYRRLIGQIGENGLKPNVAYQVADGKFVEVTP